MRSLVLSVVLGLGALGLSLAAPTQVRADQYRGPAYTSTTVPVARFWRGGSHFWRGRYFYPGWGGYYRGFYPYGGFGGYRSFYYTPYYGGYSPWGYSPYYNYGYYHSPGYFW